jgi:hypothetical protein
MLFLLYNFTFTTLEIAMATSLQRSYLNIQKSSLFILELFIFVQNIRILSCETQSLNTLSQREKLPTYRHISVDMIWGEELWAEWGLAHPRPAQHQHPDKYWKRQTANWRIRVSIITHHRLESIPPSISTLTNIGKDKLQIGGLELASLHITDKRVYHPASAPCQLLE